MPPHIAPYLWMLLGSISFAIMGTLAHALDGHCDWRLVALARTSLAFLFGLILALSAGARLVFFRPPVLWMRSIAGSLSLVSVFYALPRLPVGDVLTLSNVYPLWVAVLSWPLLGHKPSKGVWLAVLLGICGVLLVRPPHLDDADTAGFVALNGSFWSAIAMIGLHQLSDIDPRSIVVHFSAVATLICLGIIAFPGSSSMPLFPPSLSATTILMLLGTGLAATSGQLFLTKAFAAGPPARVSVVGLTQIVFGVVFGRVLWKDEITAWGLLGIALVIMPTAWVMLSQDQPQIEDI